MDGAYRAFPQSLVLCQLHFCPLPSIAGKKCESLTPQPKLFSGCLFERRVLTHEALSGLRSAEGEGQDEVGQRAGHVRSCCDPDRIMVNSILIPCQLLTTQTCLLSKHASLI